MRRKDREITQMDQIITILQRCQVCRLAFFDEPYPYIVPMNFGFEYEYGYFTLYFHCAHEGKKIDLIKRNPSVSFETDTSHRLITSPHACCYTMEYESIMGNGTIEILGEEKKRDALKILMKQYAPNQAFAFERDRVAEVTMLKLNVRSLTAKRLKSE